VKNLSRLDLVGFENGRILYQVGFSRIKNGITLPRWNLTRLDLVGFENGRILSGWIW